VSLKNVAACTNCNMAEGTETSDSSMRSSLDEPTPLPETSIPADVIAAERAYSDSVVGSSAYARLAGTGKGAIDYLVRSKVVTIGRAGCGADCQIRSEARTVSRHHATIYWRGDVDRWAITCFSKRNALMVDGAPVLADAPPVLLQSRNLIELGDAAFFFLAAVEPIVRTGDIGALEGQIEELRSARKRKLVSQDYDSRTFNPSQRTTYKDAGRSRRRWKSGVDGVHDEMLGYSSDEYHNHEMTLDAEITHRPSGHSRKRHPERRDHSGRKRSREEVNGRRNATAPVKRAKQSVRRKDDTDSERVQQDASVKDEGRVKKIAIGDKTRKMKDKRERVDRRRRRGYFEEEDEAPDATDDDQEFERQEAGVNMDLIDDGFDVAPVPSLRDYRARSAPASSRTPGSSKCREEWNKKERADFGRALFAVGVDTTYDTHGALVKYDWTRFRGIARLEKKSDAMLADYYERMIGDVECLLEEEAREKRAKGPRTKHKPGCDCVVCENTRKSRRKKEEEINAERENADEDPDVDGDGSYSVGLAGHSGGADASGIGDANFGSAVDRVIGLVTAQKLRVRMGIHEAARQIDSVAGQNVMRKLRSQSRGSAANGELPEWWVNGVHDHALVRGVARFGVGQWSDIWADVHNPEFVRARVEEGEDIEWPTPQVSMKRLREISSSINAELRRVEKKRAKGVSSSTPSKASLPSRRRKNSVVDGEGKRGRRIASRRQPTSMVGKERGKVTTIAGADDGHPDAADECDEDSCIDAENAEVDHDEDHDMDDTLEPEDIPGDLVTGSEDVDDEDDEEIELELEEEEGDDDEDSDRDTASDSD
jgi:pSer/pThr/pTyr-binding forkhead associated (FHA) protein